MQELQRKCQQLNITVDPRAVMFEIQSEDDNSVENACDMVEVQISNTSSMPEDSTAHEVEQKEETQNCFPLPNEVHTIPKSETTDGPPMYIPHWCSPTDVPTPTLIDASSREG